MDKRYIFDITTIIQWSGPSVGIVRVERELARRARSFLGDGVVFSVYSRKLQSFYRVKDQFVDAICRGEASLSAAELNPEDGDHQDAVVERILRHSRAILPERLEKSSISTLASVSLDQALEFRSQLYERDWSLGKEPSLNHYLIKGPIDDLGRNDVLVSVGLDWEYKDILHIIDKKSSANFRYYTIIHDLIPLTLPHFVVPSYVYLLKGYFGDLFWLADKCIANSKTTLSAISDHLSRWKIPPPKLGSFHLGCDLPVAKQQLDRPLELIGKKFALYVSTIEPRKNHRVLYDAYQHAVEAGLIDPEECYIVFVGHTGWNVSNLLDEIRANPMTRDRFIIYEAVTDEFLVSLYQEARMVVFPSFYEGFGLSLVEAIGLGKACIASDTPALVEVAAGRAVHVPAKDVFSWAEQMALLFNDDVSLTKLEKATEKGLIHSWDDAAAEFFKEVME